MSQSSGDGGAVRTTDSGATWTRAGDFHHPHGSSQIFQKPGAMYLGSQGNPSQNGVFKSTDLGVNWTRLASGYGGNQGTGLVTGTTKLLYSTIGAGWGSVAAPLDPGFMTAPFGSDTTWTKMTTPSGMVDGSKRIAVTNDGTYNILVAGNWHAGIWRYVEP